MLKPYKISQRYHVTDLKDVRENFRTKMEGSSTRKFVQAIEWEGSVWNPHEIDVDYFKENAEEVAWLEVLVVVGQSDRQVIWEHRACFGVHELEDEDL